MKRLLLTAVVIFNICSLVVGKEFSGEIFIYGGSSSPDGIDILITDPLNRKIGYDYLDGMIHNGVEYTGYGKDSIDDFESGTHGPKRVELEIMRAVKGEYRMEIFSKESVIYGFEMHMRDSSGLHENKISGSGYIVSNTAYPYKFYFDPTPGAPPPVLTKVVTFQTLRDDFNVAYKLNQIGDDKFVKSLIRMIDIAEMISKRCDNLKGKSKPKCYRPVVVILRMIVKRLEVVNMLCDRQTDCKPKCKVSKECDEDEALKVFDTKYRKDNDLKDFFERWDKDEWHKHKKHCKKFVTDEALEIITGDINWLIKNFGEEVWEDYKKELKPHIPDKYKKFFR